MKDFKKSFADLWISTLELKQQYQVDTDEIGPAKHHAAEIRITSSAQELWFVPTEMNEDSEHVGPCKKHKGSCLFSSTDKLHNKASHSCWTRIEKSTTHSP